MKKSIRKALPATTPILRLLGLVPRVARLVVAASLAVLVMLFVRMTSSMRAFLTKWALTTATIWVIVCGYIFLTPPSYVSKWQLILPTSNSGVSMQLESIGHAQTISSSPFGSASLSPKVIYKEILNSDVVREAAADKVDLKLGEFGSARVKLIDETSIILLEMNGPTAKQAQKNARALMDAFQDQVDVLRRDEIDRRAATVESSLKTYKQTLNAARESILEHQRRTGVLSANQYTEASSGLELLRRKISDVTADIARATDERAALAAEIGIAPEQAGSLLRIYSDPAIARLLSEQSEAEAAVTLMVGRLGSMNPLLIANRQRATAIRDRIDSLVTASGIEIGSAVFQRAAAANSTQKAELIKAIVSAEATIRGRQRELQTLNGDFRLQSEAVRRMSEDLSRLEDLKKDHIVAEAVFTSALARLDTNKVDIYASYPMVQFLAEPGLPERASSPHIGLAIIGGLLASMLALAGWSMAWLRQLFVQKR